MAATFLILSRLGLSSGILGDSSIFCNGHELRLLLDTLRRFATLLRETE